MSYLTFETERTRLVPTSEADADFTLQILNTPKWLHYIGDRNVHTLDDALQYIRSRMLPQLERLGYGNYTVVRKTDGRRMGTVGLYDRPGLEGIDLGFAFLPEYEGQGYAFESASAIIQAAFEAFGISRLEAITVEANHESQRLLKKLGFEFERNIRLPEDPVELMLFALHAPQPAKT